MAGVRLGVLGGTFDPPHVAHLVLAEQARERLALDRVLWVPAGEPWRKAGRPVTPAAHRVAMVRLAVEGHPAFEVSTLEVDRAGPSYTVETLAELSEREAKVDLYLILGEDALEDLPHWREPERLLSMTTLAVAARGAERPQLAGLEARLPGLSERIVWLEMPRLDVSATELRRRAAEGRSLRYLVPDAVARYIAGECLYRPS